jgi:hypothetical protein
VSGRIATYLDRGLGWTKPVVVACCGDCGTELARNTKQHVAERTARRRRCGSARHREPLVLGGHERTWPVCKNPRSQDIRAEDLGA